MPERAILIENLLAYLFLFSKRTHICRLCFLNGLTRLILVSSSTWWSFLNRVIASLSVQPEAVRSSVQYTVYAS